MVKSLEVYFVSFKTLGPTKEMANSQWRIYVTIPCTNYSVLVLSDHLQDDIGVDGV